MERVIILASHGFLAEGMYSSAELICGKQENIELFNAYMSEDFDLATATSAIIDKYRYKEIIVVTDLFGGSVNNEFSKYIELASYHLIAGMNLALVIELITLVNKQQETAQLIEDIVKNSQLAIKYCNPLILGHEEKGEEF